MLGVAPAAAASALAKLDTSLSRSRSICGGGAGRIGETVAIPLEHKVVRAKITRPVFFDEEGERLRG